jgi:hypothetical protein
MKMDKDPGRRHRLFQLIGTRLPEKARHLCSNVAAEHEGRGSFLTMSDAAMSDDFFDATLIICEKSRSCPEK